MYFQWYSLYFLSFHSFWTRANTLITENHFNSSSNIELYQCETNRTTPISSYIFENEIFGSCEPDCCVNVNSNDTNLPNICQVTTQTSEGVCLGRLCYSGECALFLLSTSTSTSSRSPSSPTTTRTLINSTHLLNSTRASFSNKFNETLIQWPAWRDKSYMPISYSVLILLLILNVFITSATLFVVIKSIEHAKMIAERKHHRYSLF